MSRLRAILFSLCLVTSGIGHCTSAGGWKTFKSTKYRFTVRYPASWYLFPPLDGALDILNFPPDQRVHGVILKESGARINVGPIPSQMTMEQWSKKNTEFDTQTSEREIKNFTKNPSGCTKLVEVTSLDEIGPEVYFHKTAYYCSTKNGSYRVLLSNWEGDPNQEQLQEIALKVALSLTVRGGTPSF